MVLDLPLPEPEVSHGKSRRLLDDPVELKEEPAVLQVDALWCARHEVILLPAPLLVNRNGRT